MNHLLCCGREQSFSHFCPRIASFRETELARQNKVNEEVEAARLAYDSSKDMFAETFKA